MMAASGANSRVECRGADWTAPYRILAPFALPDADDHACTVDISRRQRYGLGDPQTGRIDRDESRSHLEVGHRIEQTLNLLACQNCRQVVRPARHWNLSRDVWPPQCCAVKEPQCAHLHAN